MFLKFFKVNCSISRRNNDDKHRWDPADVVRGTGSVTCERKDETRDFDNPCYSSPSDGRYWIDEDVIEDCIEWLDSECDGGNV